MWQLDAMPGPSNKLCEIACESCCTFHQQQHMPTNRVRAYRIEVLATWCIVGKVYQTPSLSLFSLSYSCLSVCPVCQPVTQYKPQNSRESIRNLSRHIILIRRRYRGQIASLIADDDPRRCDDWEIFQHTHLGICMRRRRRIVVDTWQRFKPDADPDADPDRALRGKCSSSSSNGRRCLSDTRRLTVDFRRFRLVFGLFLIFVSANLRRESCGKNSSLLVIPLRVAKMSGRSFRADSLYKP